MSMRKQGMVGWKEGVIKGVIACIKIYKLNLNCFEITFKESMATPKPFNILFCCCFFCILKLCIFHTRAFPCYFALVLHSPPSCLGSLRTVISFNIFRELGPRESRWKRVSCKREPVLYQGNFSSLQSRRIL